MSKDYRPRWTTLPYLLVHLIILLLPLPVLAAGGRDFAQHYAWEIVVSCAFMVSPIGAWLGAVMPPPEGYESKVGHLTFFQQLVAGTVCGWVSIGLAAWYFKTVNPLLIVTALMVAFGGAGLMILLRRKGFEKINRGL